MKNNKKDQNPLRKITKQDIFANKNISKKIAPIKKVSNSEKELIAVVQFRRGPAIEWTNKNPILESGEPGYEEDTGKFKIGDGIKRWRNLSYSNLVGFDGLLSTIDELNKLHSITPGFVSPGKAIIVDGNNNIDFSGGNIAANDLNIDKINGGIPNISLKSEEIDFTISSYYVFTLPSGSIFFINSIEILTTKLISKGDPFYIKIGNEFDESYYYPETEISNNELGFRHIIQDPQNASLENSLIKISVTKPSTASVHKGFFVINGILYKSIIETPTPTPY